MFRFSDKSGQSLTTREQRSWPLWTAANRQNELLTQCGHWWSPTRLCRSSWSVAGGTGCSCSDLSLVPHRPPTMVRIQGSQADKRLHSFFSEWGRQSAGSGAALHSFHPDSCSQTVAPLFSSFFWDKCSLFWRQKYQNVRHKQHTVAFPGSKHPFCVWSAGDFRLARCKRRNCWCGSMTWLQKRFFGIVTIQKRLVGREECGCHNAEMYLCLWKEFQGAGADHSGGACVNTHCRRVAGQSE